MSAALLDGKALSARMRERLGQEAAALPRQPGLAVILVGDDPASAVYVRNKEKDCAQCGVRCLNHHLPAETTQQELLALVEDMNRREDVDGILVQLPLPEGLDSRAVLEAIRPEKDVDAFHPENVGRLMLGLPRFLPCTPAGVMALLRAYGISPAGKHCVVIGRSNIVGKPMALLLLGGGCHRHRLPQPHAGSGGAVPSGGHPHLRRGPPWPHHRRHGQARRRGRGCGHEPQ